MFQHHEVEGSELSAELEALSWGLNINMYNYNRAIVNTMAFITESYDETLRTQNSGVYVEIELMGRLKTFYSSLSSVVKLNYASNHRVFLFKCRWFDRDRDKPNKLNNDMVSINMCHTWYNDDPYKLVE